MYYMFFRYVEDNVSMTTAWRVSLDIPIEMQNRPKHFLTHMTDAAVKAANINKNMVSVVDENKFHVQSSTSNRWYLVSFGDDSHLPSCECREFQRKMLPCKHFIAIFNHCNVTFSSLPTFYRDHPLLVFDDDCLSCRLDTDTVNMQSNDIVGHCDTDNLSTTSINAEAEQHVIENIERLRKQLREVATDICNISYNTDNISVINESIGLLTEARNKLHSSQPQSEGTPLLHPHQKVNKLKRKRSLCTKRGYYLTVALH